MGWFTNLHPAVQVTIIVCATVTLLVLLLTAND